MAAIIYRRVLVRLAGTGTEFYRHYIDGKQVSAERYQRAIRTMRQPRLRGRFVSRETLARIEENTRMLQARWGAQPRGRYTWGELIELYPGKFL